jgi:hypothetical protein
MKKFPTILIKFGTCGVDNWLGGLPIIISEVMPNFVTGT